MVSLREALLGLGFRILEALDAARAREFRRRVAADGAGVLLAQLAPGAAGADQSSAAGTARDAGPVDGQRRCRTAGRVDL
ncbi:hypothetical protein [uncultured Mailhella sp.]|uniref:hypothetical protein n=1 Tax=uncultured Mailhella sp. TaxID=1981031 RepID=UPI00262DC44B|nr:hypothetical protein [uncultured Mailhella sp.]